MKLEDHYKRMRIKWNREEGFNLDIPYSGWVMFSIGITMILHELPNLIEVIRWW